MPLPRHQCSNSTKRSQGLMCVFFPQHHDHIKEGLRAKGNLNSPENPSYAREWFGPKQLSFAHTYTVRSECARTEVQLCLKAS